MKTKTKFSLGKSSVVQHEGGDGIEFLCVKAALPMFDVHLGAFEGYREKARRILRLMTGAGTAQDLTHVEAQMNKLEINALLAALTHEVVDLDYLRTMPERFVCGECGVRGEGDLENHYNECTGT